MKLYIFPPSPRAIKVISVANYLGIKPEIHVLDYFSAEQHGSDFATLNPNRRMPVLVDDDFVLWEANAIQQYLAQKTPVKGLWPAEPKQQADVLRWQFWDIAHWQPPWEIILNERIKKVVLDSQDEGRRTFGRATIPGTPDPARIAEGERATKEVLKILDGHLDGREWLASCGLSIADFAVAALVPIARQLGYSLNEYANVAQWYDRIDKLPGWRESQPPPGVK